VTRSAGSPTRRNVALVAPLSAKYLGSGYDNATSKEARKGLADLAQPVNRAERNGRQ
jgi:hypothetical protein